MVRNCRKGHFGDFGIDKFNKLAGLSVKPMEGSKRNSFGPILGVNECNREWLLKNSIFLKTAKIWGIENV